MLRSTHVKTRSKDSRSRATRTPLSHPRLQSRSVDLSSSPPRATLQPPARPRIRRAPRTALLALVLVVLPILSLSLPPASPSTLAAPSPRNLELAIDQDVILHGDGNYTVFGVNESQQGVDYNGDGDLYDAAIHAYDGLARQVISPDRHQVLSRNHNDSTCLVGNVVAFIALEDGNQDINGDGDQDDRGLALWDLTTGDVTFGPKATAMGVACGAGRVGYRVDEKDQNQDLNGDGDQLDDVWHVYRLSNGNNHNLEVSSFAVIRATARMNGFGFVFEANEDTDGKDHNKDGDQDDLVIMMYRFSNGLTYNSGLAGTLQYDERFSLVKAYGRFQPFRADEAAQSADLNADGDQDDIIGFAFDTRFGSLKQGLAGDMIRSSSRWLTLVVDESAQGATDFNSDGDTNDHILVFQNAFNGLRWNTEHALVASSYAIPYWQTDWSTGFHGRKVTATVYESPTDQDLNGDGDMSDRVIVTYDPANNTDFVTDGLSSNYCYQEESVLPVNADTAFGCRNENFAPATDFNGDGDTSDSIAQLVDLGTGLVTSTDLALDTSDPMRLSTGLAFVVVDEYAHGSSLNADTDLFDDILHFVSIPSGTVYNTGLDVQTRSVSGTPYTVWSQNAIELAFGVNEFAHGRDLNGDGDMGDIVLHVLDF